MSLARAIAKTFAYPGLAVGGFIHGIKAGLSSNWEGGESTRFRQRGPRALESQDRGLNFGIREDMLSESRALTQTFSIARKILRQYERHTVSSCRMKWNTGDPMVDKIYQDAWLAWMPMADRGARHHYRQMTKLAVASILRDGGAVAQLDGRDQFLQLYEIEYDRISSHGIYNADIPGFIGGFGLDGNGREIFAKVWERTIYGQFTNPQKIPRIQYVHAFDTDRYDAVKGVTSFHTILQCARDYKETANSEKLAAKRNSKLALLVKTLFGGAAAPAVNLFGGDDTASPTGDANTAINTQSVNDVTDAYMFPGEEMKAHVSDRPSDGWRWLMEQNIREIAAGLDLPFGVVWHMSGLGGPAARFEIAQANRVFMSFLADILDPMWHRPIVGRWLSIEMDAGRLPFTPFWYRFCTPRPKSITIDLGRDTKAAIAENAAGLGTATDWYADEDEDFEDQTYRLAYEAAVRHRAAKQYEADGVTVDEIRVLGQAGNMRVNDNAQTEQQEQEEEADPSDEKVENSK